MQPSPNSCTGSETKNYEKLTKCALEPLTLRLYCRVLDSFWPKLEHNHSNEFPGILPLP